MHARTHKQVHVILCQYLKVLLGQVFHLELELLVSIIEPLDLFLHLSLLVLCIGHLEQWFHLGEQPPPRPVAQLQVALDVALDDADGADLLHTLLEGPERRGRGEEEGRRLHCIKPALVTTRYMYIHVHVLIRDEKEEASKVKKQQGKATQHTHVHARTCIYNLSPATYFLPR